MKAHLLFADRDLDVDAALPATSGDLTHDLGLGVLLDAMAAGDAFIRDVAERVLLTSLTDSEQIGFRQDVLRDCLAQPTVVRDLYQLATEAATDVRRIHYGGLIRNPSSTLHRAVLVLEFHLGMLHRLRALTDRHAPDFRSAGFTTCFATLRRELDDTFFVEAGDHLQRLQLRDGTISSARLGRGLGGTDYVLHRPPLRPSWLRRLLPIPPAGETLQVPDRDEAGARTLSRLRDRGVNQVANALTQSTDHITSFFVMLRRELALYVGCLNLHDRLRAAGQPVCFPTAAPQRPARLAAVGLYDACLPLRSDEPVVGSDLDADGTGLLVITGANQGGKSTFLRALGLAHLMMQSGMFVAARAFHASVTTGLFTHFQREEDPTMRHGKLDEELARLSALADRMTPGGLLLCNESFASTNEREGAQIGDGVLRALAEAGIRIAVVTHLFDLAQRLEHDPPVPARFLRAERLADGRRTYRLVEGSPQATSHGQDLFNFNRIFADGRSASSVG